MHTLVDDFQDGLQYLGIFVPCDDMKEKKM